MRKLAITLVLFTFCASALATDKNLVNVDRDGVALQGYDPVAYFTEHRPVKGDAHFQTTYSGATYYFSSQQNKATFDSSPAKYAPQFGGFCAYGVSRGYTVKVEPDAFQIVNDRLLLQYDKSVRDKFNEDTAANLQKADKNWPDIVAKKGR